MEDILDSAITMMVIHESREKSTSIYEDKVLIGYMDLITKILKHSEELDHQQVKEVFRRSGIINEVFWVNLFVHSEHTPADLGNKCKTKESRSSGMNLLTSLIKAMDPEEVHDFMTRCLEPLF